MSRTVHRIAFAVIAGILTHSISIAQTFRYDIERVAPPNWKPYFTLDPSEGKAFVVDTTAIVAGGGVPVVNITNDNTVILTSAGGQMKFFEVRNNGRSYVQLTGPINRGPDGGFVYLPDGRTRFLTEEPAPNNTPQRHRSRIVSWISNDGRSWSREQGIRYQPGAEDDSIASVPSVIQVRDSVWRMYYVGDFYRTNGSRTAISSDWGVTWRRESNGNILKRGDVDPQPVYLSDGRIRLYFRTGFGETSLVRAGVAYNESDDGVAFEPAKTVLLVADSAGLPMLKLDPNVVRFPNGDIACYIGAAPAMGSPMQPRLIAAWARRPTAVREVESVTVDDITITPNPVRERSIVSIGTRRGGHADVRVFDLHGREVARLFDGFIDAGKHALAFDVSQLPAGLYFCRAAIDARLLIRPLLVVK